VAPIGSRPHLRGSGTLRHGFGITVAVLNSERNVAVATCVPFGSKNDYPLGRNTSQVMLSKPSYRVRRSNHMHLAFKNHLYSAETCSTPIFPDTRSTQSIGRRKHAERVLRPTTDLPPQTAELSRSLKVAFPHGNVTLDVSPYIPISKALEGVETNSSMPQYKTYCLRMKTR